MTAPALVQKLWNYCSILRDDGLSCGDYVEVRAARAFAFLPFLKMADEQSRAPYNQPLPISKGLGWDKFVKLDSDDLETLCRHILKELGRIGFRPHSEPTGRGSAA